MEQIQKHEIRDIYRLKDGVLIAVNKYKPFGSYLHNVQKNTKVVRGCTGLRVFKDNSIYPEGTYFFKNRPISKSTDPDEFHIEIKSSGGSIEGNIKEIEEISNTIKDILKKY